MSDPASDAGSCAQIDFASGARTGRSTLYSPAFVVSAIRWTQRDEHAVRAMVIDTDRLLHNRVNTPLETVGL